MSFHGKRNLIVSGTIQTCRFAIMDNATIILDKIKNTVLCAAPTAEVILYGSYARGNYTPDSDIDILILLDTEKPTKEDIKRIQYPLYDIEFETGIIISPIVFSKKEWETKHKITPFYENIYKEGRQI